MMDVLLLPALLSALISVGFCAVSKARKHRPPVWPAICIAFIIGASAFVLALRENSADMPTLGIFLYAFGLFAFASLAPAVIVIALYRFQMSE